MIPTTLLVICKAYSIPEIGCCYMGVDVSVGGRKQFITIITSVDRSHADKCVTTDNNYNYCKSEVVSLENVLSTSPALTLTTGCYMYEQWLAISGCCCCAACRVHAARRHCVTHTSYQSDALPIIKNMNLYYYTLEARTIINLMWRHYNEHLMSTQNTQLSSIQLASSPEPFTRIVTLQAFHVGNDL